MILADIAEYVTDKISSNDVSLNNYVTTDSLLQNKRGRECAQNLPPMPCALIHFQPKDILIANIRPYLKKIWFADIEGGCSSDVLVFRAKEGHFPNFLYATLMQDSFYDYVMKGVKGSKMPRGDKEQIMRYKMPTFSSDEEQNIGKIVVDIEKKLQLSRALNDNLEQQAQALFDHYFDSGSIYLEDSIMGCLTDIAVYLNGLAMQKFPATDIERSLPVLKIKELGQRKCDDCSDRCSDSIDADYIIDNEDIIFSWSGTLMVDVWCGGKCGLNQHLFKVTPLKNYPRWFVYYWTNRHLKKFKLIAKDKAVTMGHIRRGDLENAEVAIPTNLNMLEINARINPLFQSIIDRRLEITKLENIRDALLPKLMSGELTINEI